MAASRQGSGFRSETGSKWIENIARPRFNYAGGLAFFFTGDAGYFTMNPAGSFQELLE